MLNRIKWGDEIIGQKKEAENKDTPGERNDCSLVSEFSRCENEMSSERRMKFNKPKKIVENVESLDRARGEEVEYGVGGKENSSL